MPPPFSKRIPPSSGFLFSKKKPQLFFGKYKNLNIPLAHIKSPSMIKNLNVCGVENGFVIYFTYSTLNFQFEVQLRQTANGRSSEITKIYRNSPDQVLTHFVKEPSGRIGCAFSGLQYLFAASVLNRYLDELQMVISGLGYPEKPINLNEYYKTI